MLLTLLARPLCRSAKHSRGVALLHSEAIGAAQESLGGNAKTLIIAVVSPMREHAAESTATLAFAARAKCIRNAAFVNQDMRGDAELMRPRAGTPAKVRMSCRLPARD